jgi:chromosomal replication initiator protein
MSKVDLNAIGIKPLNSFEQLVVGPNNQVAVSACQAILQSPGETYNPLFIYGPAGVGKTHLMQAVAQEMLKQNPSAKVRYLSAERFMSETLMAISDDRIMDVRRAFGQLDLLVLDDVQYLGESKISQEELIHVFNNLHQANHQLLLAADRSPNQLTTLSQTLRTRFEWGLATDVHVPDMPTRIEILKKKQILQDIHLDDAMLAYVAERLRSNVRELEGFLKRMHAYITLSHQTLSMDLVKSVVSEISPEAGAATNEPDAMAKRPAQREPAAPPPPPPPPPVKEKAPF